MSQVGIGLGKGREGEALRHRAVAESLDLRKDEPHPVTLLASRAKLRHDLIEGWLLRFDEALETRRVAQRGRSDACPERTFRLVPGSPVPESGGDEPPHARLATCRTP